MKHSGSDASGAVAGSAKGTFRASLERLAGWRCPTDTMSALATRVRSTVAGSGTRRHRRVPRAADLPRRGRRTRDRDAAGHDAVAGDTAGTTATNAMASARARLRRPRPTRAHNVAQGEQRARSSRTPRHPQRARARSMGSDMIRGEHGYGSLDRRGRHIVQREHGSIGRGCYVVQGEHRVERRGYHVVQGERRLHGLEHDRRDVLRAACRLS